MRNARAMIVLMLSTVIWCGPSVGQSVGPSTTHILFMPVKSCTAWTETRSTPATLTVEGAAKAEEVKWWLLGYVSGVNNNPSLPDFLGLPGVDGPMVIAWVDSFCVLNPYAPITDAAQTLIHHLFVRATAPPASK